MTGSQPAVPPSLSKKPWGALLWRIFLGMIGTAAVFSVLLHVMVDAVSKREFGPHFPFWFLSVIVVLGFMTVWIASDTENKALSFVVGIAKSFPFPWKKSSE